MNEINANNIHKQITTTAIIMEIDHPFPIATKTVWECKSCMKLHEVNLRTTDIPTKLKGYQMPKVCPECGGNDFKPYLAEWEYTTLQEVTCNKGQFEFDAYLQGNVIGMLVKDAWYSLQGVLKVDITTRPNRYYLEDVSVEFIQ